MTAISLPSDGVLRKAAAYVALTKPRIIELLLITTVPAMVVAAEGWPGWRLVFMTVVGGSLAAGGANATNMYIDRDIDKLMERTRNRPLVTGEAAPVPALVFAVTLQIAAFALLWAEANLLAASIAIGGGLFYIFVYSLWLKRNHRSNIVIGGAAGSVPPVVGWAAVTGDVSVAPLVLFLIVFLWTPPHFWALAMKYADDYRSVDVPMLPSVATDEETTRRIVMYSAVLLVTVVAFGPIAGLSWIYAVSAIVAGGLFLAQSVALQRDPSTEKAMKTFVQSITMLTVVFVAMALDQLVLG